VWRVRCVTEQVPCTTYVTKCITEKVPYTVCKKVCYNETRQVPYTVRRTVRGAYVDAQNVAHDCEGPGRAFKCDAVIRKQVPYTVSKMVNTVEKKMVCRNVSRCARGAYVDAQGCGHNCEGPGRTFQEVAQFRHTTTTTSCRMVQERVVKKVPYCVWENVVEKQIKQVPYQVCRMVPTTVIKKVPTTVCEIEKFTVCRKVAYTECVQQLLNSSVDAVTAGSCRKVYSNMRRRRSKRIRSGSPAVARGYGRTTARSARPPELMSAGLVCWLRLKIERSSSFHMSPRALVLSAV